MLLMAIPMTNLITLRMWRNESWKCKVITTVIMGDMNLIFKGSEGKNRAFTKAEQKMAIAVRQIFSTVELVDGWSLTKEVNFTWTGNRNGQQSFSTLDRIYFSKNLMLKEKTTDWSLSLSDHAMVLASFNDVTAQKNPCPSVPRLDPRILEDSETTAMMDSEFNRLHSEALDWDPHTALEYCKMSIRTAAFTAVGKMKARMRDEEKLLNDDINDIINKLSQMAPNDSNYLLLIHKLEDLRGLKKRLIEKIGTKLQQRTARQWHNEGESSNKYFLNLLNGRTDSEIKISVPLKKNFLFLLYFRSQERETEDGQRSEIRL